MGILFYVGMSPVQRPPDWLDEPNPKIELRREGGASESYDLADASVKDPTQSSHILNDDKVANL